MAAKKTTKSDKSELIEALDIIEKEILLLKGWRKSDNKIIKEIKENKENKENIKG